MRVVASLTTMPYNYKKLYIMLQSLNKQSYKFDAIYLSLPNKSRRTGKEYPQLPTKISNLCTVVACEDYGPITKILGGLLEENDSDTVIITFDDDMIYDSNVVTTFIKHHREEPNIAIGSSGMLLKHLCPRCAIVPNENSIFTHRIPKFNVPKEGRYIDSIYGYPGALYLRGFFPPNEKLETEFLSYALINNDMLMNDDIVISGYLSLKNIKRKIYNDFPEVTHVTNEDGVRNRDSAEISYNIIDFFNRMNRSITESKKIGMYASPEYMDSSETILGIFFIVIPVVLFILLFVLLIIYDPYLGNSLSF